MAISGRIEGGEEVVPHSIPWQVTIFDRSGDLGNDIAGCGGTLISSKHVLTAAHCVKEDQNCAHYSVGVGMHKDNVTDGTRVMISHISNHPNYRYPYYHSCGVPDFDYSILHLATPVEFNEKVIPACLPDKSMDDQFLDGKNLTVSGWGIPRPGVLHKASYPAHTNEECKTYFNESNCDKITPNMLCAGNPNNRTASHSGGDSGGSFFKKGRNVYRMKFSSIIL